MKFRNDTNRTSIQVVGPKRLIARMFRIACGSFLLVAISTIGIGAEAASAHTCGTNWCSGSDDLTATNSQGNGPQIYIGEVGVYYSDPTITGSTSNAGPCTKSSSNPDGACFSTTGANSANSRDAAGTGLGTQYNWILGGPNSTYEAQYGSPYCFGWVQGGISILYGTSTSYFGNYWTYSYLMFADIEQPSSDGWYSGSGITSAQESANRQVINGFEDYVAGRSSADPSHCSNSANGLPYQYGIYSQPSTWVSIFGSAAGGSYGQFPNTPIWTIDIAASDTDPGSFSGVGWIASSSYDDGDQFWENPDHDLFYEPIYLPIFSSYDGT
jgi:hypothetical protein